MPENYFFTPDRLSPNTQVIITGGELHHLNVIRRHSESHITLLNGRGSRALAQIESINKSEALVSILSVETLPPPKQTLTLIQSILKPAHLDYLIEKGTEVGVSHFRLFVSKGAEKQELSTNQRARLEHLAIASMKQSGRIFLPSIEIFSDLKSALNGTMLLFYGDFTEECVSPFSLRNTLQEKKEIGLVIGSEKGFTDKERELLKEKAQAITLSKNILRAETAGVVGSYIIQELLEEDYSKTAP